MNSTVAQLRAKMCLGMDTLGMEMKKWFEQVMYKLDPIRKSVVIEGYGSSGNSDTKLKSKEGEEQLLVFSNEPGLVEANAGSKITTKYSKLECPQFDGSNFRD